MIALAFRVAAMGGVLVTVALGALSAASLALEGFCPASLLMFLGASAGLDLLLCGWCSLREESAWRAEARRALLGESDPLDLDR